MKRLWTCFLFLFILIFGFDLSASHPLPAGDILPPNSVTDGGTYSGVNYSQYDGLFCMKPDQSGGCESLVPYRITAPTDPDQGNGILVLQPPHFVEGLATWGLARDFLLGRR